MRSVYPSAAFAAYAARQARTRAMPHVPGLSPEDLAQEAALGFALDGRDPARSITTALRRLGPYRRSGAVHPVRAAAPLDPADRRARALVAEPEDADGALDRRTLAAALARAIARLPGLTRAATDAWARGEDGHATAARLMSTRRSVDVLAHHGRARLRRDPALRRLAREYGIAACLLLAALWGCDTGPVAAGDSGDTPPPRPVPEALFVRALPPEAPLAADDLARMADSFYAARTRDFDTTLVQPEPGVYVRLRAHYGGALVRVHDGTRGIIPVTAYAMRTVHLDSSGAPAGSWALAPQESNYPTEAAMRWCFGRETTVLTHWMHDYAWRQPHYGR